MQTPGISLQALPNEQLNNDFTYTSGSPFWDCCTSPQLSVFKLENANLVCLELTDTGTQKRS
jgi:hypothetical protein